MRYAIIFSSPRELNGKALSFVWMKEPVGLEAIISTRWRRQKKHSAGAEMCHQIAFQHCEPPTGHHFTALWWSDVLLGGKIIWKSTSSTLNYLPLEFKQRDEVEFALRFHLTRSGSCCSRQRFDISVTSSRDPRKHSPGTGRQLSLLNLAPAKKQILDTTWNKTLTDRWRRNVCQGERQHFTSPASAESNTI